MGRAPCCSKVGLNRGAWSAGEDNLLVQHIEANGEGNWRSLPKKAGLRRCGKSCRLRWLNYLRPSIKRGNITPDEEELIIRMHALLGNRWAIIAGRVPGRTDNEIKNYWNTNLSKKLASRGIDPRTHKITSKERSDSKRHSDATQQQSKQRVQVPQLIAPNVYNPKADPKIHGLIQDEHGVSTTPSLNENMHCSATVDEALNVEIHNCSNLCGDDRQEDLWSESHLNAHNSNESSNGDDNDEIRDMFRCILDFGRAENEAGARHDAGWLQEQLQWNDAQDICAAMWEPSWW